MALTPFRWIAAATIGMLVMLMGIMTDPREFIEPYRPTPGEIEERRLQIAAQGAALRASALATRYRIAQLTDSLRPLAERGSAPPAIRVTYGANIAPTVRMAIDSVVLKASERVGPAVRMGTDVVATLDTFPVRQYAFTGAPAVRPFYVLPRDVSQRCIVVLRVGRIGRYDLNTVLRTINTEDGQQQLLGPCAYYAAFGMPGTRVREWLRQRGASMAYGGSWTRVSETPRLRSGKDAIGPYGVYKHDEYFGVRHAALEYLSYRGIRCALGELAECEAGILQAPPRARQIAVGPAVSPMLALGPLGYRLGGDFSSREAELLAGMVRALGRERFAGFWTSNEPLPLAFEKVSGVSLGAWVSEWVNERMDPIRRGPKSSALTVFFAALVVIGCVLATTLVAMRRQYS